MFLIITATPEFTIVAASDAYLSATRTVRENIVGRGIFDVFPDDPKEPENRAVDKARASFNRVIESGATDLMGVSKHSVRSPDAEGGGFIDKYWSPVNSPVFGQDGKVAFIFHRVEDVTAFMQLKQQGAAQKELSEELKTQSERLQSEVFTRAQEIQDANQKLRVANVELQKRESELGARMKERGILLETLKKTDQLKTDFFANISHELRTPLALILGPAERWLSSSSISEEQRRDLELIARNGRALLKTVNELLDISKLEAGKFTLRYADIDLAHLVRLTCSLFENVARERRISFEFEVPQRLSVQCDSEMIRRVLVNLLSNAFKFVPDGGRIVCRLFSNNDRVTLQVQDNGPGVPREMHEAVFERFRQVEGGPTRKHGGTGLGLAIAKDFIELHHGEIRVEDPPGGGALFIAHIPLRAPEGVAVEARPDVQDNSTALQAWAVDEGSPQAYSLPENVTSVAGEKRPVVLVVEDNPDMNRFISQVLHPEFKVVAAFDGKEGLRMALNDQPDLILSDVMMPRMSGDQLVAEIRRRPVLDNVPIVLLTAKADDHLKIKMLQGGAQDYIMKPFAAEELRTRARNLISIKRTREMLEQGIESKQLTLEQLARESILRREELRKAFEDLKLAKNEAERLLQLRDEFIALASHELRTPLAPLSMRHQLIQSKIRDGTQQPREFEQFFQSAGRQIEQLENLVNNLLDVSRIGLGYLPLHIELVDLSEIARRVADDLAPQLKAIGSSLELHLESPLRGQWDSSRIEQVLTNLLGNAIKYGQGRPIQIHTFSRNDDAMIQVRDRGMGVSKEDSGRIFNRFERAVSLKNTGGLGLGLYIARQIVMAHNGSIDVQSEPGAGASFTVVLPKKAAARAHAVRQRRAATASM